MPRPGKISGETCHWLERLDENDECLYRVCSGCLSSFCLTIESLQVKNNHFRTLREKRKLNLALRNDLQSDKFQAGIE